MCVLEVPESLVTHGFPSPKLPALMANESSNASNALAHVDAHASALVGQAA